MRIACGRWAFRDRLRAVSGDPGRDGATLARGAAANALALLAANFRGVFTFLIARLLGGAALGTFSLAFAVTDLLSKLGTLGLDGAAVPLVAQRQAEADARASRRILRIAVGFGLVASGLTALVGMAVSGAVGRFLGQPEGLVRATALMLLALPGIALYRISNGVSRGCSVMRHDFYSRGLVETWVTVATFLGAFALGLREVAPIAAVIVGTGAGGVVAFVLARGLVREGESRKAPPTAAAVLGFAAPIAGTSLVNLMIMRMDVLLLGAFVGRAPGLTLASFGVYCAAVEVAGGMRKVRQVFDPIFAPVVAARMLDRDTAPLAQVLGRVGRWVFAAQLPLVGVLGLSGGLVLSVFGGAFREGAPVLLVLGVAHATNAFVGLGETVIMVKRPGLNFLNSMLAAAGQAALLLVLVPRLGALGGAIGALFAYSLQGVLRFVELRLVFGWSWPWTSLRRPVQAFLLALPGGLILRLGLGGPAGELAAALALVAGYALAWKALGLEPEDRDALRRAFFSHKAP